MRHLEENIFQSQSRVRHPLFILMSDAYSLGVLCCCLAVWRGRCSVLAYVGAGVCLPARMGQLASSGDSIIFPARAEPTGRAGRRGAARGRPESSGDFMSRAEALCTGAAGALRGGAWWGGAQPGPQTARLGGPALWPGAP